MAFSLEDKYLAAVGSFEHRGRYWFFFDL